MNNLIQIIKTKILENKNNILFVVFFMLLLSVDNTFAADNRTARKTTEFFNTIIAIWNTAFAIWAVIIWVLTQFIWLFLQPEWMTGSIIWLDWHLKSLWVLVSNIVYFIFAFLIIIIAFMNIVWKWDNNYQLKTALPHFIVWILIVPFSWFIIQFILSISAILTVSALSLPYDLFWKWTGNLFDKTEVSTNCSIDMDKMMGGLTKSWSTDPKAAWIDCTGDKKSLSTLMSDWNSLFSIMYIYTYWVMKIQDLDKLTSTQLPNTSSLWTVAANLIFNWIFVIAFLILLIALWIAMFSRGVVLWLFTIFSPVFWLIYFFNWKVPKALEKISFKEFLWVAMVPVYVWLALSFWLLFTFVATQWLTNNASINSSNTKLEWNTISVWWMNLTITWAALWSYKNAASSVENKNVWQAIASGSADFLAQLIVDLIALAVLWMAVMAALKSSTITANVVQPIASFWESIWKTAMKLPQYAPVFPGWQSAASMQTIWSNISWSFESAQNRKWTDFYNKTFGNWDKVTQKATEINPKIENAKWDIKQLSNLTQDLLKEVKDTQQLSNSTQWIESLKKIATEMKIDKDKIDKVKLWDRESVANLLIEMDKKSEWVWADIFNQKWAKLQWFAWVDLAIKDLWNSNVDTKINWDTTINLNNLTTFWINSNTNNWKMDYSIWDTNIFAKHIQDNKSEFWWDAISKEWLKESLQKAWLNWKDDEIKIDEVINKLWDDFFKAKS